MAIREGDEGSGMKCVDCVSARAGNVNPVGSQSLPDNQNMNQFESLVRVVGQILQN